MSVGGGIYRRIMPDRPKPIRYDLDTWLVMRTDKVLPKAVIQRVRRKDGDRYLLFKWDLDPTKRLLVNVCESLETADGQVLYDTPRPEHPRHEGYPSQK